MTQPDPHDPSGWVARSFTRARVLGTYVARVPLGDKSVDLPAVLSRAQLLVAGAGVAATAVAWMIGSALGVTAWLVTPVVVATLVAVIALKFSAVPERGTAVFLGGYARMLLVAAAPRLASTRQSSRAAPRRRGATPGSAALRVHPAAPDREC